jgi:predicted kinase
MLCGLTGAGKTSAARRLVAEGCVRLSVDRAVYDRHGPQDASFPADEYLRLHDEAIRELDVQLVELLGQGHDVVLDYSRELWTRAGRDHYKQVIEQHGGRWELIYLQADRDLLLERLVERNQRTGADAFYVTEELLDHFIAQFEEPSDEAEIVRPQRPAATAIGPPRPS